MLFDIFDCPTNIRIINGSLPAEKIHIVLKPEETTIDVKNKAEEGISFLTEHPEYAFVMLYISYRQIIAIEQEKKLITDLQPINSIINFCCYENVLFVNSPLQEALHLSPVVTDLDKAIWYLAYNSHFNNKYDIKDENYNPSNMMFAWIFLLQIVQKHELETGLSLNFNAIDSPKAIIDLLLHKWGQGGYFLPLTEETNKKLKQLSVTRDKYFTSIQDSLKSAQEIATRTQNAWECFISAVNDLSERESYVVSQINADISAKDKLAIIRDYNYRLTGISNGRYSLNGEDINLFRVLYDASERMEKAPFYCQVFGDDKHPFRISPFLFMLFTEPKTYNYLFITYHYFRLSQTKEQANSFALLALTCMEKNLGVTATHPISLQATIKAFCDCLLGFVEKNKSTIETLSFDTIQTDASTVDSTIARFVYSNNLQNLILKNEINHLIQDKIEQVNYDDIEKVLGDLDKGINIDELREYEKHETEEEQRIENEALARQVIISLNIIYLFADAIKIMLNNKRISAKFKSKEIIEKYRLDLLKLDDYLVHKVYAHLNNCAIGMLEYREKRGIIASTLSDREAQEESFRNKTFGSILKDAIDEMVSSIGECDIEGVLKKKQKIREAIMAYPECDAKSTYADWLDEISSNICNHLVEKCKKEESVFLTIRNDLHKVLGALCNRLPKSTIDSLATAELLYDKYASELYASEGFDYSCVSALYYQAFEDAYNSLIWKGYAEKLNSLTIDGQSYGYILKQYRYKTIDIQGAKGYLPVIPKNRSKYIEYGKREDLNASVINSCMYKSFANMMEKIRPQSDVPHFCEYIASLAGYDNIGKMICDNHFMINCKQFSDLITLSTDYRNNASHGGSFISKSQCATDKRIVLYDLESIRNHSLGLIQQLLDLLFGNSRIIN